jgi:plasmid replication initiation protein
LRDQEQQEDRTENPEERSDRFTKDEMNFAELPLALPCHRPPKGKNAIRVTIHSRDAQNRPIEKEWLVTGDSLHGLPLATDEEVFLGLMHLLHRAGFKDRRIHFTQYSLFQRLGWGDSQRSYDRLQSSFDRLKGATIRSREAFWDHKGKCFVTKAFNVIDDYALFRRGGSDGDEPFVSSVTFSEFVFESFRAGFIKTLDLDMYLELASPIARKLFRLLDKKLYKSPVYDIDLMHLAQRVALTNASFPSQVRKQFKGAHQELIDIGFLKSVRYLRKGDSTVLRYTMAAKSDWKPVRERVRVLPPPMHPLVAELTRRGITREVAEDLLKQHDEKSIADKLEVFDHLRSQESPMLSKNPAGFLRSSIEKDFAPPTDYISRAERQRRKDEELAARQLQEETAQHEEKQRADKRAQLDALWDSLSTEERSDLEIKALDRLNPFARKNYRQEKDAGHRGSGHYTLRAELDVLLATQYLGQSEDPSSGAQPIPAGSALSASQEPV